MVLDENKEIKVTASDALEFEPVSHSASSGGWTLRILLSMALFGVGAVSWGFYGDTMIKQFTTNDGDVPIIEASTGPIKVRPENPGGLEVPNRDKLVYDRMQKNVDNGNYKEKGFERLLPSSEQPIDKSEILKNKKPQAKLNKEKEDPIKKERLLLNKDKDFEKIKSYPVARVPTIKDVKTAKRPTPPPLPPQAPGSAAVNLLSKSESNKQTEVIAKIVSDTKAQKKISKSESNIPKLTKNLKIASRSKSSLTSGASKTTSSFYHIQLAATRSSKLASAEWERLKGRHLDLLGRLSLTINKVDLGSGKGIFYRLRAGPLADERKARELCKTLAKRKVGCLMIKPMK